MHVLENERLIVLISAENSALEVHDKAAGVTWKQPYGEVILRSGAGRANFGDEPFFFDSHTPCRCTSSPSSAPAGRR